MHYGSYQLVVGAGMNKWYTRCWRASGSIVRWACHTVRCTDINMMDCIWWVILWNARLHRMHTESHAEISVMKFPGVCLMITSYIMKSWWSHGEVMMKSWWSHGEVMMKSWWSHDEVTMKSSWSHGKVIRCLLGLSAFVFKNSLNYTCSSHKPWDLPQAFSWPSRLHPWCASPSQAHREPPGQHSPTWSSALTVGLPCPPHSGVRLWPPVDVQDVIRIGASSKEEVINFDVTEAGRNWSRYAKYKIIIHAAIARFWEVNTHLNTY